MSVRIPACRPERQIPNLTPAVAYTEMKTLSPLQGNMFTSPLILAIDVLYSTISAKSTLYPLNFCHLFVVEPSSSSSSSVLPIVHYPLPYPI